MEKQIKSLTVEVKLTFLPPERLLKKRDHAAGHSKHHHAKSGEREQRSVAVQQTHTLTVTHTHTLG